MSESYFTKMAASRVEETGGFLCTGLDPEASKIPGKRYNGAPYVHDLDMRALCNFLCDTIDVTGPFSAAFKPNLGFFGAIGDTPTSGIDALSFIIKYARAECPHVPIILDGKFGDIGNTAEKYALWAKRLEVQAVTVNPYMGTDAIQAFVDRGIFCFVLCYTTNPSSIEFERHPDHPSAKHLFLQVAETVANKFTSEQCGFVVAGNNDVVIEAVRRQVPRYWFLIPGIGTQGGSIPEITPYCINQSDGSILSVANVSRSLIYDEQPQRKAEAYVREMKRCLELVRKELK